jgi:hypothetical protein
MILFLGRYNYLDEEAESHDELIHPENYISEEYIDFRTYPLKIDWQEVEDDKSQSVEIYNKYKCLGAATYTCLHSLQGLKLTDRNILKAILEYYYKLISNSTNNDNDTNLFNFIKALMPLNKLNIVLDLGLSKQELPLFKIILDIYEHYLINKDKPVYNVNILLIILESS